MEITISELKSLLQNGQSNASLDLSNFVGQYVVVRSNLAGVFIGKLMAASGRDVVLSEAYQAWRWSAKNGITLLSVANNGVDPEKSKIDGPAKIVAISDFCEIVISNDAAYKTFGG